MDPGPFEFQTMMTTVANGMSGNMIPAIVNVAYIFMIISLMLGVYEAYVRGGDTKGLAGTVMKFIVVAFVIGNWSRFFADLNSGFNTIAQQIDDSYGAGDLLKDWGNLLVTNWNNNGYTSIWNLISGGAAIVNSLEIALAYMVFPIATQLFTLIYIFWGAVLYAVGPLVLALAPSRMINGTAKFYAQNLFVWNCWAVLYAVFACLITAVNGKDLTTSPFFSGAITGAQTQVFIGLTSIIYSVCILLIPLIAMAVLKGEFGGVAGAFMSLISVGTQVSRAASTAARAAKSVKGGSGNSQNSSAPQGGSGGGTYQSRPPNPTPPRATVP